MKLGRPPQTYDESTYASPYWIVRYPHQLRYSSAVSDLLRAEPASVLDYGAGDGRLLVDALGRGLGAEHIVAFEPVEKYAAQLATALAAGGVQDRVEIVRDRDGLAGRRFDYVVCLGVLEHMPLLERQAFYDVCDRTLTPHGRVLVDVPVEIGPALLIKALGRRILKGQPKEYSWPELIRYSLGAVMYDPARFDPADPSTWIQDHRGFDYRLLRAELAYRFDVVDQRTTPLPFLPAPLGNQEVFLTLARLAGPRAARDDAQPR